MHETDLAQVSAGEWRGYLDRVVQTCQSTLHHLFATVVEDFEGAQVSVSGATPSAPPAEEGDLGGYSFEGGVAGRRIFVRAVREGEARWRFVFPPFVLPPEIDPRARHEGWDEEATSALAALSATDRRYVRDRIGFALVSEMADGAFDACTLFPAERFAINIFARELALKRFERPSERGATRARYPWPIQDSLRQANDLASLSMLKSPFADLADEMEGAVLGGAVAVSEHGDPTFAPAEAGGRRLAIHLTASVVKSLASLVFYFRHLASRNDFIIIDEPELNLHPDNQRKVARILAKAVRRGFRIMLSTHSDHFVRELSHLVMLSKLPADEARAMGFDPDAAVPPEALGVYLFDQHTAVSVPVQETGFSVRTIDDEINKLNDDAQRLYSRLFG
jgi:hypothetical protein